MGMELKRSMRRRRKEGDGKIKRVPRRRNFVPKCLFALFFGGFPPKARGAPASENSNFQIFSMLLWMARAMYAESKIRRLYACANISTLRRYARFSALNRPFDLPIVGDRRRPFPHPSRPGPRPRWWSAMVSTATARRGRSIPSATTRSPSLHFTVPVAMTRSSRIGREPSRTPIHCRAKP